MDIGFSLLYRVGHDVWRFISGRRRALSQTEVVQLRGKWQPIFDEKIHSRWAQGLRQDVIIRDVKRSDAYPETDGAEKGISAWFRAGLVSTYHRGIQVGLGYDALVQDDHSGQWRYASSQSEREAGVTLALLGMIRFENVESVNWEGDEYYNFPHIYCHFVESKRQPYERLAFFERKETGHGHEFFTEVVGYDDVIRS